jgi:hypothetical protein
MYFQRQAGDSVSAIYCIAYGVEGKPGMNTVDRILLHYNSLLLETSFLWNCIHMCFVVL